MRHDLRTQQALNHYRSHELRAAVRDARPAPRTRPEPVRRRLGRALVRAGARLAADPSLAPARPC